MIDLATSSDHRVRHEVGIRAITATSDHLIFADTDGGVFASELSDDGLSAPVRIDQHDSQVIDLDVSPHGRYVAVASAHGISLIELGDSGWSSPLRLLEGDPSQRNAEYLAFGGLRQESNTVDLIAAGTDPRVRWWRIGPDSITSEVIGRHPGTVRAVAAAPDSSIIFTAGQAGLQRWDLETGTAFGTTLLHHRSDVTAVSAWDSETIVSADSGMAVLWDLATTRVVQREGLVPESWAGESTASLVYGDGPLAIVTNDQRVMVDDGTVHPAPSGVWRAWWVGPDNASPSLLFERRNLSNVSGGVELFSAIDGRIEPLITGVDAVAVDSCLAAVASGTLITFHDVGSCEDPPSAIDLSIDPSRDTVVALLISADDSVLTVALSDDTVTTYDLRSGRPAAALKTEAPGGSTTIITGLGQVAPGSVVVGRDIGGSGQLLVTDSDPIDLPWHDDAVWWIAGGAAGQRVFMGGEDGVISQTLIGEEIRLINMFTAEQSAAINDPVAMVRGIRYLDETAALVTVQGFRATAWELRPGVLIERICRLVGRDITESERTRLSIEAGTEVCPQ